MQILKNLLKSKLPRKQVNLLRLIKDSLKNPSNIKRELNNYKYSNKNTIYHENQSKTVLRIKPCVFF